MCRVTYGQTEKEREVPFSQENEQEPAAALWAATPSRETTKCVFLAVFQRSARDGASGLEGGRWSRGQGHFGKSGREWLSYRSDLFLINLLRAVVHYPADY